MTQQTAMTLQVGDRVRRKADCRSEEPRGYTRSAYDAQIEELETLVDQFPSLRLTTLEAERD